MSLLFIWNELLPAAGADVSGTSSARNDENYATSLAGETFMIAGPRLSDMMFRDHSGISCSSAADNDYLHRSGESIGYSNISGYTTGGGSCDKVDHPDEWHYGIISSIYYGHSAIIIRTTHEEYE